MLSQMLFAVRVSVVVLLAVIVLSPCADGQDNKQRRPRRSQAAPGKEPPHPPAVGAEAPNFTLKKLDGAEVELRKLTAKHPVVLLVLRGWPEYQCPICSRQVGEFLAKKDAFQTLGAEVVMVYPGPSNLLDEHALEFQADRVFNGNFHYVTDPDYKFTNAWGLRWEAPRETAYPSTFIIGQDNKIKFGVTSTSHGDRASAAAVLDELAKPTSAAAE